jgi:hypothetical protein
MSYFGLKSQIILNNCEWGIKYFKLKGRKKSLEGRMRPAGRTLAMSDIDCRLVLLDEMKDLKWYQAVIIILIQKFQF